jgi:hypothetical protein
VKKSFCDIFNILMTAVQLSPYRDELRAGRQCNWGSIPAQCAGSLCNGHRGLFPWG